MRYAIVALLITALLWTGFSPTAAQDDGCVIDMARLASLLNIAQAAYDAGDIDLALDTLAVLQNEITAINQQCGTNAAGSGAAPVTTAYDLGYMTDREGQWDIMLRHTDGSLTNVTAGYGDHAYFFNFTASGEMINFYAAEGGSTQPAVVNADGSGLEVFTFLTASIEIMQSGNIDYDLAWSPGGAQIAWTRVAGMPPALRLYIASANFSTEQELSGEGLSNTMPAWSPDGSRIVFTSDRSGGSHVYVVNVTNGNVQRLTIDGYNVQPVWSLDGTQIMFISERETPFSSGQFQFYVMNADGSNQHRLGTGEVFTGDPTTSPDGTQIAFMSNRSGYWHIYLMNSDSANVQQITEGSTNNLFPAWRPVPAP